MQWRDFEAAAPTLAAEARAVIERAGFVYLGTVRSDGAPRISPVEAHVVDGHLMLVMIAASRKARDVARDPRVTLQSPVKDAGDPGAELKVRGRVTDVDERQRTATARHVEVVSGWQPQASWRFLSVLVDAVALLDWQAGEMLLSRWDRVNGLRPAERRRLDLEASAYRRLD